MAAVDLDEIKEPLTDQGKLQTGSVFSFLS